MFNKKYTIFCGLLSNFIEAFCVIALGFGLFIYSSTQAAFSIQSKFNEVQNYNSYDFIFIVLYEIIMLSIIITYLKFKKWKVADFNLHFNPSMIGIAIILVLFRFSIAYVLNEILKASFIFNALSQNQSTISLQNNLVSTLLIIIVNSVYEEFLLIGYLFKRFQNLNTSIIIFVSFMIRLSFHTYQGWESLAMVFSIAIVFGMYYKKYKKLWPVIIAHAIGNMYFFLNEHI